MAITGSTTSSSSSFYVSAPTSPEKHLLNALPPCSHEPETYPPTSVGDEDAEADLDGFEFETSQRFCYIEDEPLEGGQIMSFADELFSGAKVLPLKPPPKMGTDKSSASARSSPRMTQGGLLSWKRLTNHDSDPFQTALLKVRKEECQRVRRVEGEWPERRARSMSPLRGSLPDEPCAVRLSILDLDRSRKKRSGCASEPVEQSGLKGKAVWSPKMMARPRGLEFARRVMLVRTGNAESFTNNGSELKARQKMNKLPPKKIKPMTGKPESSNEEKIEISAHRCTEKRRLSKMLKMAIVRCRPRFLICLGYGIKTLGKA